MPWSEYSGTTQWWPKAGSASLRGCNNNMKRWLLPLALETLLRDSFQNINARAHVTVFGLRPLAMRSAMLRTPLRGVRGACGSIVSRTFGVLQITQQWGHCNLCTCACTATKHAHRDTSPTSTQMGQCLRRNHTTYKCPAAMPVFAVIPACVWPAISASVFSRGPTNRTAAVARRSIRRWPPQQLGKNKH